MNAQTAEKLSSKQVKSQTTQSTWERLSLDTYKQWYKQSIEDPDTFWSEQAERFISWINPWKHVRHIDYERTEFKWFEGAELNVAYNCLDRHLPERSEQVAFYWEGDNGHRRKTITYQALYQQTCQFANVLKKLGIQKGDTVCLYMPMIPQAIVAMLACARIGAIHSVVFAGFSAQALAQRIYDANAKLVITSEDAIRGGKAIPLKEVVDQACECIPNNAKQLVIKNSGRKISMAHHRDVWFDECCLGVSSECPPEPMHAEDPLFILYTSGSTGQPKGVLHTQAGYLLFAAMTHRYVFDYQPSDCYWCTADIGWITGHTYTVYGPLANGAKSVLYEGVPTGPDPSFIWQIVDRYQVSILYTAPTAIRALMAQGDDMLSTSNRDSLRILGTVGEPINPEAWRWYAEKVGKKRCWVVDTWWQTETGGVLIAPIPNISAQKPGAACMPFFGVQAKILTPEGDICPANTKGALVIESCWPGQMRTVYKNHSRFVDTYFKKFPHYYSTGDGAFIDTDGDFWISGRMDDVINISGHRLGTAEVESALVLHPRVSEAAVIGVPHKIKGESLYCFVTLNKDDSWESTLESELQNLVIEKIGKFAKPETLQWAPNLPKTRSGKIMRRILRKIANNELDQLGDISTLAEPEVIESLIAHRRVTGV